MNETVFHPSGLVEIQTSKGLVVLTAVEYAKARRRGKSVTWNRALNGMRVIHEDRQMKGSTMRVRR
jgi:hypothetical protein